MSDRRVAAVGEGGLWTAAGVGFGLVGGFVVCVEAGGHVVDACARAEEPPGCDSEAARALQGREGAVQKSLCALCLPTTAQWARGHCSGNTAKDKTTPQAAGRRGGGTSAR